MLLLSLPDLGSNCARCGSGFDLESRTSRLLWNYGHWQLQSEIKSRTSTAPLSTLRLLARFHAKQLTILNKSQYQNNVKPIQLATGRSPGGESSWPELVNIANGVSCSNTQRHHWSRQWDRAPRVTAAALALHFRGPAFNSMRNFAQCPLYRNAQCHMMTRGARPGIQCQYKCRHVVSLVKGEVPRHAMQKNRHNRTKHGNCGSPLRIAWGELRSMMQRHLSPGQLLPSGPVQISWPQIIVLHNSARLLYGSKAKLKAVNPNLQPKIGRKTAFRPRGCASSNWKRWTETNERAMLARYATLINIPDNDIAGWSLGILLARLLGRPVAVPNPRSRTLECWISASSTCWHCSSWDNSVHIAVSGCFRMFHNAFCPWNPWISGGSMNLVQLQCVTTLGHLTPKIYLPR